MNYTKCAEQGSDDQTEAPAPKPKTPEEMKQDPKAILNPEVVKDMGANEEITQHTASLSRLADWYQVKTVRRGMLLREYPTLDEAKRNAVKDWKVAARNNVLQHDDYEAQDYRIEFKGKTVYVGTV